MVGKTSVCWPHALDSERVLAVSLERICHCVLASAWEMKGVEKAEGDLEETNRSNSGVAAGWINWAGAIGF